MRTPNAILDSNFNDNTYTPKLEIREKFLAMPFPSKKNLKQFFGLLNVYRSHFKDMHLIEAPFKECPKKNAPYIVTDEMKAAFDKIKCTTANLETLHFPIEGKILYLDVDASVTGRFRLSVRASGAFP